MIRWIAASVLFLLCSATASAAVEVRAGKFWFNGIRKDVVIGRSSFKTANCLTYHFTGQGRKCGPRHVRDWIAHNQRIFGRDVVLRVFLETGGWGECSDCMFGSEPRDQGFWNRERLRDGAREREMHSVGRQVLEWFFAESERSGVAWELVIDATLKHDDIPAGEIDHVIRVVGVEMGELAKRYPRALVIPNVRNEWNAHNQSGHSLADVNMWAVRWDRDEYWPGAPKIVDPGGGNTFSYDVGPEPGKYRAGMIHPDRGGGWERFPNRAQLQRLRDDARGMPVGFTESMYYVEARDRPRAERWYRRGGWTTNLDDYWSFVEHAVERVDYFVVHDEKGAQSDPMWPRPMTALEKRAAARFAGMTEHPYPEPPPPAPPVEPPAPQPPGGIDFDLEQILALLKLIGIDLGDIDVADLIAWIGGELSARGKQLDRIEAELDRAQATQATLLRNQAEILAGLRELDTAPAPTPDEPAPVPTPESPAFLPRWDDVKDELFERAPYARATYRLALFKIDQQLIWDGIRNPNFALSTPDYPWPHDRDGDGDRFPPIDRDKAREIAETSQELLDQLRHFVTFDPRDRTAVATGGTWIDGRTRVDSFEQWYRDFSNLYPWIEAANFITQPGRQ